MKKRLTPEEFVKLAREISRDERVPYAFEKRVMARLADRPAPDLLSMWTRALWRAVAPCFVIMVIAAALAYAQPLDNTGEVDLDLESAVLAVPEAAVDLSM